MMDAQMDGWMDGDFGGFIFEPQSAYWCYSFH